MTEKHGLDRRKFLKRAAGAVGAVTQVDRWAALAQGQESRGADEHDHASDDPHYPRRFSGRKLKMIAFPLGGVAAGSIGLGGRGQLVNWEIFNRPNKGFHPSYAFASIWAQAGDGKAVAHVLESRILPPYEGPDGLGSSNAPGLSRLESATFTGEYPLAHIDFEDGTLPVKVELDAFSPFIPHEPDDSGLPVAILRYRVTNPGSAAARVAIAFSIDNPVKTREDKDVAEQKRSEGRRNAYRSADGIAGYAMSNPSLAADDPMAGEFVLAATPDAGTEVSHWEGWPQGRWWNSPLLFWDQFSKSGDLGPQPEPHNSVGALCLKKTIPAGPDGEFSISAGLAISQSHTGLVWLGRASGRGQDRHRQLLRRPVQGRMGSGHVHGSAPCRPGSADTDVCRGPAGEHAARCGERSGQREPFHAGHDHLFSHRGWRVSRLRGQQRPARMLLWQLHPRVELRDGDGISVSVVCPVAAAERLWLLDGRRGRDSLPADAAGRQSALGLCGGRRADGADSPRMAGLEDIRGRCTAARRHGRG